MPTKTKSNKHSGRDAYMSLIRRLPLRPIRDDSEHDRAVQIVSEPIGRDVESGTGDYLETLVLLVNKYEDEHHTLSTIELSPREAFRAIMEANDLSQAEMGKIIGSESAVSMFLKGDRELSKTQIKALVARFRVSSDLFL